MDRSDVFERIAYSFRVLQLPVYVKLLFEDKQGRIKMAEGFVDQTHPVVENTYFKGILEQRGIFKSAVII